MLQVLAFCTVGRGVFATTCVTLSQNQSINDHTNSSALEFELITFVCPEVCLQHLNLIKICILIQTLGTAPLKLKRLYLYGVNQVQRKESPKGEKSQLLAKTVFGNPKAMFCS